MSDQENRYRDYAELRLCESGAEIDSLVPKGAWRLLAIVEDEVVAQVPKSYAYQSGPGCYPSTYCYSDSDKVKRARLLMGLRRDDAMSNAIERAENAESEVRGLRDNVTVTLKELAGLKEQFFRAKERIKSLEDLHQVATSKRDEIASRYTKLEADLAKVLLAIGEERFSAIVGKK